MRGKEQDDHGSVGSGLTPLVPSPSLDTGSATPSQAVTARILIFADDPERTPRLYACPKCGQVNSPRIYACRDEIAHATAKRAAEECYNCRTHNACQTCGAECEKHWLLCATCRLSKRVSAAAEIEAQTVEECFGVESGEYYHSTWDAAEAGEEWVHPGLLEPFELSPDSTCDNILDGHHDDADPGELIGWDELEAAIIAFNERQTGGSYMPDYSRVARVALVEEGVATTPTADGEVSKAAQPLQPTEPKPSTPSNHTEESKP